MADGIKQTPGAGAGDPIVDTDEVTRGGQQVHQQVIKIALGADGAFDAFVDSGQQVAANSIPVVLASDQSAIPVSGPLTDAQLRAAPVPVSGTVTASGPLTDAQLRASAVPVSAASLPLPTGAATAALQLPAGHAVDTELPTAIVLADGAANPTVPGVGANALIFNGTTWDRARGDIANGLDVDVTRLPSLVAGTANIGDVDVLTLPGIVGTKSSNGGAPGSTNLGTLPAIATAAAPTYTEGNQAGLSVDLAGALRTAGGAGGTQYTEDAVAATDPVGTQPVMTRRDTPTALVTANLDVVSQQATNFGAAYVQIVTSGGAFVDTFGGAGGTAQADESAFTEGATNFTPIGGVLNDTITSDPTEDQAAAARITPKRGVHANPRDQTGLEIFGTPAAIADDMVTPTVGKISSYLQLFDSGSGNWDRAPGNNLIGLFVGGAFANDAAITQVRPLIGGGRASATAPTDVSADGDAVASWHLRNGAQAIATADSLNRTASGALGALNAAVTMSGQGVGQANWEIDTGTLVGTVVFEATLDDANWFAINAIRINGTIVSSIASFSDRGALDMAGYSQVRLRVSAFTSGTSNARLEGSFGSGLIRLSQALPAGSNTIGSVSVTGAVDTELPAAETPADALTNATDAPRVGAFGYGFNGTTWDRLRSDTANGLDVDVTRLPALVAGTANIGDVDVASFAAGAITEVQGDVADDAVAAGNPVLIGLIARQTNRTAVADGDAVRGAADDIGRQVVILNNVRDLVTDATITLSTTTETTLLAAGGAGVFHDATLLVITNTSATAVRVDIRDATAGTVRLSIAIAANGGAVIPFAVPRPQATANGNWTAQLSAAVTDVRVYLQAVKNV